MGKKSGFGNNLGDALLEAMASVKDSSQKAETLPVSRKSIVQGDIKESLQSIPKQSPQCSRPEQQKKPFPPRTTHPALEKLFYNALKRSVSEIKEEFHRPSTSLAKKKGMIEGVSHAYYSLQNKADRSPASQQTILDYQVLLAELKEEFKSLPSPAKPVRPGKQVEASKPSVPKKQSTAFSTKSQFEGFAPGNDLVDVVVGFDFGTACSKIVIRTPYEKNLAYLVPFDEFSHSSNKYLLPTHISVAGGKYLLPETGSLGKYNNLKLALLQSLTCVESDETSEYTAIAYLTLVFRYIRSWFLRTCKENYPCKNLLWKVNIGVPSATAENEDICCLYKKAVMVAWTLSLREVDVSAMSAEKIKNDYLSEKVSEDEMVDVKVFPEVAAEVIGYTQSDMRQEGLHLMADVGAGTLDICGFNVHRSDGENVLPIFSTNVEPLGVKSLHQARCEAISSTVDYCHSRLVEDVVAPMSHELESYIPDQSDFERTIDASETKFAVRCSNQLRSIILDLKKRHAPRSDRWQNQLPLFLCGGGSKLHFYKNVIQKMSDWMRENEHNHGLRLVSLPRPEALAEFVDEDSFHRFGVAWGLSHSPYDIDRVMTNITPVYTNDRTEEALGGWWERPISYSLLDD